MRRIGLGLLALAALALLPMPGSAAHADPYKWCAHLGGHDDFGTECYYLTYKQCMDTVAGIGGSCEPNLSYDGRPVTDEYPKPQRPPRKR